MRVTTLKKKCLAFVIAATGLSSLQAAWAQAVCTPLDGSAGAVIAGTANTAGVGGIAGSRIISVDTTTGKYTIIADVSGTVPAADGINVVANNPNNSLVYFTSNLDSGANKSLYAYNLVTGVTTTVIADVTLPATGIVLSSTRGIASGSNFYDSASNSLFIGIERPAVVGPPAVAYNSTLYQIPLNAAGTANSGPAVVITNDATNWGDIVISGGNIHSFGTNGTTTTFSYKRYTLAGAAVPAATVNLGTTNGTPSTNYQSALDRLGNVKVLSSPNSTIQTFDVSGTPPVGVTGTAVNITSDGTTVLATNSINDAASCTPAIATIGDTVWADLNANGTQQVGEAGIAGVTVELYSDINGDGIVNGSDALLGTTTTDGNGNYTFTKILPGQYTVKTVPGTSPIAALTQTNPDVGGANSRRATISTVGGVDLSADFGYRVNADLQITKTNGLTSVSSGGTTTYTIVATNAGPDTVLNSVVTDPAVAGLNKTSVSCAGAQCPAAGNVTLANLEAAGITIPSLASGQSVTFTVVADVTAASGSVANTATMTGPIGHNDPTPGNNSVTDNDTVIPKAVITGNVYYDKNRNSTNDGTDTGIQGVQLELRDASGNPLPTPIFATTDVNGNYTFTVPVTTPATVYTIVETQPAGFGSSENPTNAATVTASGGAVSGPNFGETKAQIAGTVFRDDNNNGIQDGAEPGIQGVTVTVTGTDVNGTPLAGKTATTDINGNYTVLDLFPADASGYTVTETQPAAYNDGKDTAGNATTPGTATNGATPATQDTITGVNPSAGQAATGYNYGELPTGSIGGNVYFDKDKSGGSNAGDTNLSGVTLTLKAADGTTDIDSDPATPGIQPTTTTTDGSGNYTFPNLAPGTYTVLETQPVGYGSLENGVLSPILTVPLNAAAPAANFGEIAGSLTGFVYNDFNNNGVKDAGEPGIAGVVVTLSGTDAAGTAIPAGTTATTDASGQYTFSNVLAANASGYTVTETQPAAYSDGLESAGTPAGNITVNDVTSSIPLAAAQDGVAYNFGERGTTLTGKVYIDTDKNSSNNAGDTNLAGVLVTLKDASGNDIDSDPTTPGVQPTTSTTDSSGNYSFPNLPAGNYTVVESQPVGYGSSENPSNSVVFPLVAGTPAGPNFGETLGSLSGVVFRDDNNNGTQDAGEPGIPGVIVTLTGNDATGTAIPAGKTATTDANGNYKIADLLTSDAAGYTLTETQPAGYSDGKDALGNASTAAGTLVTPDADTTTGIKIGLGQDATGYTYGEIGTSITGTVFYDKDKSGVQNGTEPGIAGVVVTLKDSTGADIDSDPATPGIQPTTATTDSTGNYSFPNLEAGKTYNVVETQPTGYGSSTANTVSVPLVAGTPGTANFGDTLGKLSGVVYKDLNNDGVQAGASETGILGVVVTLKDSTGADIDSDPATAGVQPTTTTTAADGSYTFADLPAGAYQIAETTPAGYTDGIDAVVGAPVTGGTPTNPGDLISSITVGAGQEGTGYFFGEQPNGGLSGKVFNDRDRNNAQNGGEPGISGVTINVLDAGNNIVATTTTDLNGNYNLPSLAPGTYTVVEVQPTGYGDSPASPNSVSSVVVPPNGTATVDFADTLATLSGSVYIDSNNNGTRAATETGLAGVLIQVKNAGGTVVGTATTDASGNYKVIDLPAGTYSVVEPTQPSGYADGKEATGGAGGTLPSPDNDTITAVSLAAGQETLNYTFGELGATISGTVYNDKDKSNTNNAGDTGIPGVLVTLKDAAGNDIDSDPTTPGVQPTTATTDVNGNYSFPNLEGGKQYTVVESQPTGYGNSENPTNSVNVTPSNGGTSTVNFGDTLSSLAGTVYLDADNSGVQNGTEPGIAGVIVTLKDSLGNDIDSDPATAGVQPTTATTDSSGNYKFSNIPAGTYSVVESQPAAYIDGTDAVGVFNGTPTGTLTAPDSITAIAIPAGQDGTGYLFGERGTGISGVVFYDQDKSAAQNGTEPGIPGVVVTLKDGAGNDIDSDPATPGIQPTTTTTDSTGNYSFPNLPAGNYTVVESQPTGFGSSTPNSVPVTLANGTPATTNFGDTLGSLSGRVFRDDSNNGTQDAGEPGIAGVLVTLKDGAGNDVDSDPVTAGIQPTTATTDANGVYKFSNLPAGTYNIVESQPSAYADGIDQAGSVGGTPTAPDTISSISLPAGTDATNYTFGELGSSVTGTIYQDKDKNGSQNGTDPGIAGVVVTLKDSAGNDIDSDPATPGVQPTTATTDSTGKYTFPNLPAGTYTVVETQPTGYANGLENPATTVPVTVAAGTPSTVNFGETLGSLSGVVYNDTDGNGTQNGTEPGVSGVTITLKDGAGNDIDSDPATPGVQPTTTTTDSTGKYTFANLPAGTYNIVEPTQPAGYTDGLEKLGNATTPGTLPTPDNDTITGIGLSAGQDATGYLFGEKGTGISGKVYVDLDRGSSLSAGEPGIAGVLITLKDAAGNDIDSDPATPGIQPTTTTTDANGNYSFPSVPAGTYTVVETQPSAYTSSENGTSAPVTVVAGTPSTVNFGELPAVISGTVYNDKNNDGIKDTTEPGIAGVVVTLKDSTGADIDSDPATPGIQPTTATTDSSGNYQFNGLPAGTYSVVETQPTAFNDGKDAVGNFGGTAVGTLTAPDSITAIVAPAGALGAAYNFGERGQTISGQVFVDSNNNGTPDALEKPLGGVLVTLKDAAGNDIDSDPSTPGIQPTTATTAPDGTYSFPDLPAGNYQVVETQPTAYGNGTPNTVPVSLTAATPATVNFGEKPASIAGTVFNDKNNNGIQDAGEPGISSVTLTLKDSTGADIDSDPATAGIQPTTVTTDSSGNYKFSDLPAATYQIVETQPSAYSDGTDAFGTSGGTLVAPDTISSIVLPAGTDATKYTFGERGSSLTGTVYVDSNNSGTLQPTEPKLGGVVVTLKDAAGNDIDSDPTTPGIQPTTATTAPDGTYSFPDLPAGNYQVVETQPAGYANGTPNTVPVTVAPGTPVVVDFGEKPSSISGKAFIDTNNNGVQDVGEPNEPGVTITLKDGTGADIDSDPTTAGVQPTTTITASDGTYSFPNLPAGNYQVVETQPVAYGTGTPNTVPVTLTPGTPGTANFGDVPSSLAGLVFNDLDNNGTQQAGELGLSGVTITLKDAAGNDIDSDPNTAGIQPTTAITDSSGNYKFINLPAATYGVVETQPAGYNNGTVSAGTSNGTADTPNNKVTGIVLAAQTDATAYNFAEVGTPITGRVYKDANANSVDNGEPGIAGVLMTLKDGAGNVVATTTTDASGNYSFPPQPAGNYTIEETQPVGYGSSQNPSNSVPVTVVTGQPVPASNFGETLGAISGLVFDDTNNDGIKQAGEKGLPGVTVTLTGKDATGATVNKSATTDASGNYSIVDVLVADAAGYTLTETQATGYSDGKDTAGNAATPGTATNGATPATQDTITGINIGAGQLATGYTFGERSQTIAGTVFYDKNKDGTQQGTETPLAGVVVTLKDGAGNDIDSDPATPGVQPTTATTDVNGTYSFPNLPAGTYTVVESQPTGYGSSTTSPNSVPVTVVAGTAPSPVNFADTLGTLTGTVYNDTNNDGIKQPAETGLSGVTVTLTGTNANGAITPITATTNSSGNYSFPDLLAGTYTITETQPAAFNDGKDTNGTPAGTLGNDVISSIPLTAGTDGTGYLFGETGTPITGRVYKDVNANGVDNSEPGIAGVLITLKDGAGNDIDSDPATPGVQPTTTTTDATGNYNFPPQPAGTYTIVETQPLGYGSSENPSNSVPITIAAGQPVPATNFGETVSSLAGRVYRDDNNDGIRDGSEFGIAGVTVTLTGTDASGATINKTATTDSLGNYNFPDLLSGNYTINESQPANYSDGKDSNGTPAGTAANDSFSSIPLGAGQNGTGFLFGEQGTKISGVVYNDSNKDSTKQPSEPGLGGVTVTLKDGAGNDVDSDPNLPGIQPTTTITDGGGQYSFPNLPAGNYTVVESQPAGTGSSENPTNSVPVTLANGVPATVNFGDTFSSVNGQVYFDANGNNAKDPTEVGIAGVTVTLTGTDANGATVNKSATTDSSGNYSFKDLTTGTYTITETQPSGYTDGAETNGTPAGTVTNDTISNIPLSTPATDATGYLFGETGTPVAGRVYVDTNNNGVQDPGELGLPGVTVTLTPVGGGTPVVKTTDANGDYNFGSQPAGNYTISESQPAGYGSSENPTNSKSITVTAGAPTPLTNFGDTPTNISGKVFRDDNNNGIQDGTEPGIAGVTVTVTGTDAKGAAVSKIVTSDATGAYAVNNLLSGTYTVTETQPAAYTDGKDTNGTPAGTVANDSFSSIVFPDGQSGVGYNFGELGTSINGKVFVDTNKDGTQQGTEPGKPGVTVTLKDGAGNVVATTTTGPDGSYSFPNLPAGNYTVEETQPNGLGSSTPNTVPVILAAGTPSTANFGDTLSSFAGTVYNDANNDGIKQPTEAGISNVTVTLTGTDANNNPVTKTATTDALGNYSFPDLLAGTYTITETQPSAYNDGIDTNGTPAGTLGNDVISSIVLPAGTDGTGYLFGETGTPITGTVYVDANADSTKQPTEAGIPGVTVELKNAAGTTVAIATTDANGNYSFPPQPAGTYTVVETQPAGYGSSENPTNIATVTVTAGQPVTPANFGETTSSLSGTVFRDDNNDGIKQAGEPGIAGVTVTISGKDVNNLTVSKTLTTDANGVYSANDLIAGTYTITETQPVAYNDGKDANGTPAGTLANDTISSIALGAGAQGTGYTFGELGNTINGQVFKDTNADSIKDPSESGLGGVIITLKDVNGNDIDSDPTTPGVQPTTTLTAPDGTFSFPNLPAGDYRVVETQPNGLGSSQGSPDSLPVKIISGDPTTVKFADTPSSISGTVYVDTNNNGLKDIGELGIAGVAVTLTGTDANNAGVTKTATSDANGNWTFLDLLSGTYTVEETQPSAYSDGKDTNGTPAGTVSNDQFSGIVVPVGTNATGYLFGESGTAIAGKVYLDANRNGADNNEPGIAGVVITLKAADGVTDIDSDPATPGTQPTTTTTDANGNYSFPPQVAGTYTVVETQPAGYGSGLQNPTNSVPVTVVANQPVAPVVFGEVNSSLSGTVYRDDNNDGIKDGTEFGIPGVTLTITGTDPKGAIAPITVTTNAQGDWTVPNLLAGSYTVTETQPLAYGDGKENPGTPAGTITTNDVISSIPLTGGTQGVNYNFGERGTGISGVVYNDSNKDGTKQATEPGLGGVIVTLKDAAGNDIDSDPTQAGVQPTTTLTTGDGQYNFPNLPAGDYRVVETQPAGTGSSENPSNNVPVTLVGGTPQTVNFGDTFSSIAGQVYNDANANNAKDAGEPGLSGVTITLTGTDASGKPVARSALSDASGNYSFKDLTSGTYTITETQPAAFSDGAETDGSIASTITNDQFSSIVLPVQTDATGYLFGEKGTPVAGLVFLDLNRDGIQQPGEPGIPGVTLTLTPVAGGAPVTVVTDPTGNYSFGNLPAGDYNITETQPVGLGSSTPDVVKVSVSAGTPTPLTNFADTPASLTGKVFRDDNNNGIQDGTEPGIAGATVTVTGTDANGAVNKTATTDSTGNWIVGDLKSGTYTITETQPAAYTDGKDTNGTPAGTVANDSFSSIALTPGQAGTGYTFGEIGTSITGKVFVDTNKDGTPQPSEPGKPGVTVTLKDGAGNVVATTTTGPDGSYSFPNLPAGNYTVEETQPTGLGSSTPNSLPITVTPGTPSTANFGDTLSSFAGTVYNDVNNDGVKQGTEAGISNVTVTLTGTDANGASVTKTATTDSSGNYSFPDLLAGTYTITETQPSAYNDGTDTNGTPAGTLGNDVISSIVLPAGTDGTGYLFGETGTPITGTVFKDNNLDGVKQPTEPGLPGVPVVLKNSIGTIVASTVTDANGNYSFPPQPAGNYTIEETQPLGYGSSTPNSVPVTISAGQPVPATNFGDTPSSLSGAVFRDDNNDGIKQATEPGIANTTVLVTGTDVTGNNVSTTTTTDPSGNWKVDGLKAGTYTITETQPAAYNDGKDANGTPPGTLGNDVISSITLGSATTATQGTGYNFGETGNTINGQVFKDSNANGTLDPNETGVPGVIVTLKDVNGNDIDSDPATPGVQPTTTTTDANGNYSFPNLPAGNYKVVETQPNGLGSSTPNTVPVDVRNGNPTTVLFGDTPSSIAGVVFDDTNNNGVKDPTEAGIAGVTVTLTGKDANNNPVSLTTTTDTNGDWKFGDLVAGAYTVKETQPASFIDGQDTDGSIPSTISNDQFANIVLPIGTNANNYRFAEQAPQTGTVTGVIFTDTNGNGKQDPNEPGVPNVPVTLTPTNGTPIVVTTNPDGTYSIPNVPAGTGTISVKDPAGTTLTTGNNPQPITVPAGSSVAATPVGYQPLGTINGKVFNDINGDGKQDPNEPGIPGATVTITTPDGKTITVITDKDGNYTVPNVPVGNNQVVVTKPDGTVLTTGNNPQTINVTSGTPVNASPVGFQGKGGLNGVVFDDKNGDKTQQPNEPGIAGAVVTIKDAAGNDIDSDPATPGIQPTTAITDANGKYNFPNLPAGPVQVIVTPPAGYVTTTPERNPQTVTIPTGGTVDALPVGLVKPSIAIAKNVVQGDTVIPAEQQRPEVMVGSTLRYQIKITNDGAVTLNNIKITDTLPQGLAYVPGSSSLLNSSLKLEEPTVTDGTGADKDRKVLTYVLPATIKLEPGQSLSLRLTTTVTPNASTSNEVVNKAKASASAGSGINTAEVNSDTAIAAVKVNLGVFQTPNVIAGRVYFDRNNDNNYTAGIDAPLPGARVYLSDGRYAVTDANGNYSIPEITPGVYAIRLDPITAPYPVKHVPDDQGAPGTRYVRTNDAGGISSEDFILLEPSAAAVKARSTTVQRGPVTLNKSLIQGGAGYAVNEQITLEKAVNNLTISDPLPNGNAERGPITVTNAAGQAVKFELSKDGKTISIPGTIPAGTYKITYAIFTALPPDQVLTDPDIDYEEILLGAFPGFETSRTSDEVTR